MVTLLVISYACIIELSLYCSDNLIHRLIGAVTSPTVLHTSSRVVSHGIGAPGSNRAEVQISRNISPDESDCTLFFEKDKRANDSCVNVQDCEAEAEAAASAVAVAAISSDEIVGNGLGSAISEAKTFEGTDVEISQCALFII